MNVGLQKATLAHGTATFVFESACKLLPRLPQGAPGVQWLGYLLVVHLGGSRVLFHTVSMDARLGVEFLRRVNPRIAVPVHYDDYGVFCSPLSDFEAKVAEAGLQESVTVIPRGVTFDLDGR